MSTGQDRESYTDDQDRESYTVSFHPAGCPCEKQGPLFHLAQRMEEVIVARRDGHWSNDWEITQAHVLEDYDAWRSACDDAGGTVDPDELVRRATTAYIAMSQDLLDAVWKGEPFVIDTKAQALGFVQFIIIRTMDHPALGTALTGRADG